MRAVRGLAKQPWFPVVRLGTATATWVLWALEPNWGWTVALALVPWLVQVLTAPQTAGFFEVPIGFFVALVVFLLTAWIGLWAGYDRDGSQAVFANPIGWQKLWGLLLAVVLFYNLATLTSVPTRRWALAFLSGLGAAVALAFAATHDWTAEPALWEPITRLGQAIQAPLPALTGGFINPNIAGGVIAPLLPLAVGLAVEAQQDRRFRTWGLLTAGATALGLLLTTSRGAAVALAGTLTLAGLWWAAGRIFDPERRLTAFAGLTALVGSAAALLLVAVPWLRQGVLGSEAFLNRLRIFSQAALLVRDYPFTGSGLGIFPLVHSTYALLIHVPVLSHAHALPLNIAVEQGLVGAGVAIGILGGGYWLGLRALTERRAPQPILAAGLASLAVMTLHGLVDDALYSSRGVFLLWAPAGLVVAASGGRGSRAAQRRPPRNVWYGVGLIAAGLVLLLARFGRPLLAAGNANMGAVTQSLIELPIYGRHEGSLDQIRRRENMAPAEAYYRRALALNPEQATARTRLAQLALARGAYDEALAHAEAAWAAGHRDRVTRMMLSDALIAHGRVYRAAALVQNLERAEMRLEGQAHARYWKHEDWRRAAHAWRAVLLLAPQNEQAQRQIEQAEARRGE